MVNKTPQSQINLLHLSCSLYTARTEYQEAHTHKQFDLGGLKLKQSKE